CQRSTCGHSTSQCHCTYVIVPETDLAEALKEGCFPVVQFKHDAGEDIEIIRYDPWEYGPAYDAFSHVWSDGRGNEQGDALPLCRL
ncbi:uncharacterized protein A1O5_05121, partial [Cladophialophora psammophila CBS 110553]